VIRDCVSSRTDIAPPFLQFLSAISCARVPLSIPSHRALHHCNIHSYQFSFIALYFSTPSSPLPCIPFYPVRFLYQAFTTSLSVLAMTQVTAPLTYSLLVYHFFNRVFLKSNNEEVLLQFQFSFLVHIIFGRLNILFSPSCSDCPSFPPPACCNIPSNHIRRSLVLLV